MKRIILGLTACFFAISGGAAQSTANAGKTNLPRIAIAGLGIESSTFSPAVTHEEAFHARYGADVFLAYPFLGSTSPLRQQANWFPALVGKSLPGGAVTRRAYESLVNKTLDSLKKNGPYEGLYLDIHLTPGGVDQDLTRLAYKRIGRPMFPFDKDMKKPDLSARLVHLSGESK